MTGIVILVPLVVTFLALRLVFQWLAGSIGNNVVGKRLIGHGNEILARIPIIGSIYSPFKQFIDTVAAPKEAPSFTRVVLAEYPADDRWILGFATGEVTLPGQKPGRCVFVPTSPNPATGWMVIFPQTQVVETDLTVEEAMRQIVSGGIVIPETLGRAYTVDATNELDFPTPPGPAPDALEAGDSVSPPQSPPRSEHAG